VLKRINKTETKNKMKPKEFIDSFVFDSPLPEGELIIQGNLNLQNCSIQKLPDNLTVLGYLSLNWTKLSVLPKGLKVMGYLYIKGTQIESIPEDLICKVEIISDRPIKNVPALIAEKVRIASNG
jgi:Leucine-rich repeat (LRR) protein